MMPPADQAKDWFISVAVNALVVLPMRNRMTACVLACLYLTDSGSLTASELTRSLQVSPASVSKAIGELEQQELIRRERDPRRRRDRYVIDADAWFRGWMASAHQNTVLAEVARRGAETLGTTSPVGARLRDFGQFFEHVGHAMIQAAEQWRQTHARGERPTVGENPETATPSLDGVDAHGLE
ncbi:MarR family transcriptional regulator [Nocardia jinanensis]|nr:MarR family transcriptional regulator [Nocardia jinanensis]